MTTFKIHNRPSAKAKKRYHHTLPTVFNSYGVGG